MEHRLPDSEEQYQILFENNPLPMLVFDLDTLSFLAVNDASINHYGYSREEFLSMTIKEIHPPEDIPRLLDRIDKISKAPEGLKISGVWRHQKKDETVIDVEIRSHSLIFAGRRARLVLANDITERKRAEEALKENEERLRSITQSANDAIISADSSGKIISWNKGAQTIFGYGEEEVLGKPIALLMPERYREAHLNGLERMRSTGESHVIGKTLELHGLKKDGTEFPLELSLAAWCKGKELFYSGIIRNITIRKEAEETIYHLAYYDVMTGLPNHLLFHDDLQRAISEARSKNRPLALLIINLDRFKEINNTIGHHNGDLILQQMGKRLQDTLKEADMIARPGGDTFAILFKDRDADGAILIANKIIKRLEEPFVVDGLPLNISASIGIALFPGHGDDVDTLIRRADIAMYAAKNRESGFAIYSPKDDQYSPERLALMGELRHAIEEDQLFLLYQPKIELKTGKPIGVEALVRWQHPRSGIIPPDQFIFLAEHTGLINELTFWVIKEALRQSRSLYQAGIEISLAVNLSVRSLRNPDLTDRIKGLFSTWGIAPSRLRFEITESAIMADQGLAMNVITQLTLMGIRSSIDDFGTGYSSLGYLQKLPVDEIKIDKSFVMNILADKNSAIIVRSIIELGHNLGLKVVAEGVENREIMDSLASLNCDFAQGYFISRPIPAKELIVWLDKQA